MVLSNYLEVNHLGMFLIIMYVIMIKVLAEMFKRDDTQFIKDQIKILKRKIKNEKNQQDFQFISETFRRVGQLEKEVHNRVEAARKQGKWVEWVEFSCLFLVSSLFWSNGILKLHSPTFFFPSIPSIGWILSFPDCMDQGQNEDCIWISCLWFVLLVERCFVLLSHLISFSNHPTTNTNTKREVE